MGLLFADASAGADLDPGTVAALKANSGLGETATGGKWTWERGQTVYGSTPDGSPLPPSSAPGALAFHPAGQGPGENYFRYDDTTGKFIGTAKGSKVQSYASGVLSVAAFAVGANAVFGNADLGIQGIAGGSAPAATAPAATAPAAVAPVAPASGLTLAQAGAGAGAASSFMGLAKGVGTLFGGSGKPTGGNGGSLSLGGYPAATPARSGLALLPAAGNSAGGGAPIIVETGGPAAAAAPTQSQGLSTLEKLAAFATIAAAAWQLWKGR